MATPIQSVPLPERTTHFVRVLWARSTHLTKFTSWNKAVVGRWMHWGDKHSELCLKPEMMCPHCQAGKTKLWYGWLFGRDEVKGGSALLQITATAVRENMSLRDPAQDLRGATIELTRLQDRTGSLVTASVKLYRMPERYTDQEPDTLAHLLRFYKIRLPAIAATHQADEGES